MLCGCSNSPSFFPFKDWEADVLWERIHEIQGYLWNVDTFSSCLIKGLSRWSFVGYNGTIYLTLLTSRVVTKRGKSGWSHSLKFLVGVETAFILFHSEISHCFIHLWRLCWVWTEYPFLCPTVLSAKLKKPALHLWSSVQMQWDGFLRIYFLRFGDWK